MAMEVPSTSAQPPSKVQKLSPVLILLLLADPAHARLPPKKFESAREMSLNSPAIEANGNQLFCVAPPEAPAASLIFASITWDISFKAPRGRARAASDDDFHEYGRSLVGKFLWAEPDSSGQELDAKLARRPLFPMPWDSCPSPFSDCVLDLSPFGNSCLRASSSEPYAVKVVIDRGFPVRPMMVLLGCALLAAAHPLSANVPVQYFSAMVAGECIALCLLVVYLLRRAGYGMRSKAAAAGAYALLVLGRGGTIVKSGVADHWELALVYMLAVAAASCWVTTASRNMEGTQDMVRVATKWILRCLALSLLHNAFKAPAAQFVVYSLLILLYIWTRFLKLIHKNKYYREEKTA